MLTHLFIVIHNTFYIFFKQLILILFSNSFFYQENSIKNKTENVLYELDLLVMNVAEICI